MTTTSKKFKQKNRCLKVELDLNELCLIACALDSFTFPAHILGSQEQYNDVVLEKEKFALLIKCFDKYVKK